jgi:hypothetical protein
MTAVKDSPWQSLLRRLSRVGFTRTYVRKALPEWWEDALWAKPTGFAQGALILSRNLGVDLLSLRSSSEEITFEGFGRPKLKRTARTKSKGVGVAQAVGYRAAVVAAAATSRPYQQLPESPKSMRDDLVGKGRAPCVNLDNLLDYCWDNGLPIIHVSQFPARTTKFDGMATVIHGRPVIVLANNHSFGAWQTFILAHELGHVACGHLQEGSFLVDKDIRVKDGDREERQADDFAAELLLGNPRLHYTAEFRLNGERLAEAARKAGSNSRTDPGVVALNYGYYNNMMGAAMNALKILEPTPSAKKSLHERMVSNIDSGRVDEDRLHWFLHLTTSDDPK